MSIDVRLLTIKSKGKISQWSSNQIMVLMRAAHPPNNLIPKDYYRAKRIVLKLGLTTKKINFCVNGCILFYIEECKALKECMFCGAQWYNFKKVGRGNIKKYLCRECTPIPG